MKLGSSDRWSLVDSSLKEFFNLVRWPRIRNKNLKNISIFRLQIWSTVVLTTTADPTISNFFSFQIFWPSSIRLALYSSSSNLLLDFYVTSYWIVNHKSQIEKIRPRTRQNFILYRAANLNHPRLRVSNIFTCLFTCLRAVSYWHEELYSTSIIVQSPRIFSLGKFLPLSVILAPISTDKKLYFIFQIFSQVDILFSIGGKYYTGEPITYTYMEDKIFESSRNITIKLHHRVGKYVKLRLHFSDRWIMISEVTFDSGKRAKFLMFEQSCASRRENIGIRGSLSKEQAHETRDPRGMIYRTIFIETFLVPRSEVSSDKTYSTRSTFTHVHICMYIYTYRFISAFVPRVWG